MKARSVGGSGRWWRMWRRSSGGGGGGGRGVGLGFALGVGGGGRSDHWGREEVAHGGVR